MHLSNPGFHSKFATLSLILMLVTLWLIMHGYHGIKNDAQIYAFQALARLHPHLAADLYLQNTSQDKFTLFSPLYAAFIGKLGLECAARLLTLVFTVWLLAATWNLVSIVTNRDAAWLAVALLLIVAGNYGASGVFRILDPFLTARLPAQALIVTSIACYLRGMRHLALLVVAGALAMHPLMALPGLLMLVCLWLPLRVSVGGAICGVFATLAVAATAAVAPTLAQIMAVMDAPWLDVVRERSQFLFLRLWSVSDWSINAQPFICLAFTAFAVADAQIRKLCAAAVIVGSAGLAVAFVGTLVGPLAIVVQGQAWRWVWITVFVSAALVPFIILQIWRDDDCGPLCSLLLVLGWTLPGADGTPYASLALIIWLYRAHINRLLGTQLRWVLAALGISIVIWVLIKYWTAGLVIANARALSSAVEMQKISALKVPAVLFVGLLWWIVRTSSRGWVPLLLSMLLAAFSVLISPAAFKQFRLLASAADIYEFADWKNAIPPTSTVLIAPPNDAGAFVWFTLDRPNYLATNQSAGVVFSRATAMEVRRRSEVLLPIMDPDWKILARIHAKVGSVDKNSATTRPLSARNLIDVCADPRLGFVISPAKVDFGPLRHEHAGAWKDWNLYNCENVRSPLPAI